MRGIGHAAGESGKVGAAAQADEALARTREEAIVPCLGESVTRDMADATAFTGEMSIGEDGEEKHEGEKGK